MLVSKELKLWEVTESYVKKEDKALEAKELGFQERRWREIIVGMVKKQ